MPTKRFGPSGVPVALPDQVTPRKGADLAPVRAARETGQAQPGRHGAQGTESQSLSDPVAAADTRKPGTGAPTANCEKIPDHPQMLAEMRRILRLRHYAGSTKRCYLGWCRRFLRYVGRSGEHVPTTADVQAFLSYLALQKDVASATQNRAFHGVLFLLRHVLLVEPGDLSATVRAREGEKLPVVLLPEETRAVLVAVKGTHRLMLKLVYGDGLRLGELRRLRVKDQASQRRGEQRPLLQDRVSWWPAHPIRSKTRCKMSRALPSNPATTCGNVTEIRSQRGLCDGRVHPPHCRLASIEQFAQQFSSK